MDLVRGGAMAADARVVISTSEMVRRMASDRLYDYDGLAERAGSAPAAALALLRGEQPERHVMFSAYGNAKLWAVWWAAELARRLPEGVAVFAVSPGSIPATRSPASLPWALRVFFPLYRLIAPHLGLAWSAAEGARQYLVGAGMPADQSGGFYGAPPGRAIGALERQADPRYDDPAWSAAVWAALAQETGHTLQIDA